MRIDCEGHFYKLACSGKVKPAESFDRNLTRYAVSLTIAMQVDVKSSFRIPILS